MKLRKALQRTAGTACATTVLQYAKAIRSAVNKPVQTHPPDRYRRLPDGIALLQDQSRHYWR